MTSNSPEASALSLLQTTIAQREALLTDICAHLDEVLFSDATALFISYPDLQSFTWQQYTPYLPDKECLCAFHAWTHEPSLSWFEPIPPSIDHHVRRVARANVCQILSRYSQEVLLRRFGDPRVVTVNRQGISSAFFEHT